MMLFICEKIVLFFLTFEQHNFTLANTELDM